MLDIESFDELLNNVQEGSNRPKAPVGGYSVKLISAEYRKTQAGDKYTGYSQWEVVDGDYATALINIYTNAGKDDAQTARNLSPIYKIAIKSGIDKSKILDPDDVKQLSDVIETTHIVLGKAIRKGANIFGYIEIKENPKDAEKPYKNLHVDAPVAKVADSAPAIENPVKAKSAKKTTVAVKATDPAATEKIDTEDNSWLED